MVNKGRDEVMTDCLIIGFNDSDFGEYEKMIKSMGTDSGPYRDLNLAFVKLNGQPYRALDIFSHIRNDGFYYHNADFLWPTILYLGSYLHQRGFSFDYVNLFQLEKEKLKQKLRNDDLLTIAITTTLYVSPHPIVEIVSFIRQHNQKAKIVVGGPYVSNKAQSVKDVSGLLDVFNYIGADIYVINQEGEFALVNVLQALKNGASLEQVDNIAYKQNGSYALTRKAGESNPLEENMVDYSLFPAPELGPFLSLRTAKSCPFSCSFCAFPTRAGKYTYMSVACVERELDAIKAAGTATHLYFMDDTFNVPKKRFQEILRMMIRNEYNFKWKSFYRSDHGDEETIALMKESGCQAVFLGVESGSDTILEKMRKTARREHYFRAIPLLKQAGIMTHANLIIGFPGETYETVQETIDFLETAQPDFYRAQLWYADPVTPVWKKKDEYGIQGSAFNWSHNTMDSPTAIELVDKLFLCVENTTWMPQWGFEQWSVLYLQEKGMPYRRVKDFIDCFNTIIKDKLLDAGKEEIPPALLENLRRSCLYDDPQGDRPDMALVEPFSGARYVAAEAYWQNEFRHPAMSNIADSCRHPDPTAEKQITTLSCPIDTRTLRQLRATYAENLPDVILAAYSLMLSRLNGRGDTTILVTGNEEGAGRAFPVRLHPVDDVSLAAFVRQVGQKHSQAIDHSLYALYLVTNPHRHRELGSFQPSLDAAYTFSTVTANQKPADLETTLRFYPDVFDSIKLLLRVVESESTVAVEFLFDQRWLGLATVARLSLLLQNILTAFCDDPHLLLEEIANQPTEQNLLVETDATEEFSFG